MKRLERDKAKKGLQVMKPGRHKPPIFLGGLTEKDNEEEERLNKTFVHILVEGQLP